jgi:hypothetical protein
MELNVYVGWTGKNACAYVDEVPGFVIGSKNVKTLQNEIREALEFHANGCLQDALERKQVTAEQRGAGTGTGDAIGAGTGEAGKWFTNRAEWRFIYHYDIGALLNLYDGILNQSNFARIAGVNTSLMRHYVCGVRNPSKKKLKLIEKNLRTFASDLSNIRIGLN